MKIFLCLGISIALQLTHLVIPFHVKQMNLLKQNLRSWAKYPPCGTLNIPTSEQFNLVFYPSSLTVESDLWNLLSEIDTSCFKSTTIKAGVDDPEHTRGARLQFEKMLNEIKGEYVFQMEPDCFPVRSGWLAALNLQCIYPNQEFWMKGSLYRGTAIKEKNAVQSFHINGNAIYNLHDKDFKQFYFKSLNCFLSQRRNRDARGYDSDIYRYLFDLKYIETNSEIMHKFVVTELIQNRWRSFYSVSELTEKYPSVYLVHGKTFSE